VCTRQTGCECTDCKAALKVFTDFSRVEVIAESNEHISPIKTVVTAEEEMKKCSICERSFNAAAFEVHGRVCKKVFGSKRPAFNAASKRVDVERNGKK
jgi:hypothetical protein